MKKTMIKREKSLVFPASYRAVFETSIKTIEAFRLRNSWGIKVSMRIRSANYQAGTITARLGTNWRIDVAVQGNDEQSTVHVSLIQTTIMVDAFGLVGHSLDEFMEQLFQNITPFIGNRDISQPLNDSPLQGSQYSSKNIGYRLGETSAGSAFQWFRFLIAILFILGFLGALLAAAQNAGR